MGEWDYAICRAVHQKYFAINFVNMGYIREVIILYFCLWSKGGVLEHAGQ